MRSNVFTTLGGFALLLLAGVGCQKEEALNPFMDQKISVRSHDCLEVCIDAEDPVYYPDAGEVVQLVGGNGNYRRIDFEAYNTLTDFEVNWTYSATAGGNRTIIVTVNSGPATQGSIQSSNGPSGSTDTFVFSLTEGWDACDVINYTVSLADGEGDVQATGDFTYALVGQCVEESECEESFSYTDNEDGTYTFSYTSLEDVEDAHLVFTFPQAVVVSGLDGWTKRGVTYQNVQNLTACSEYTWTVGLECSGKPGARNLWTDFKVNDVSKKNENTPNIVGDCN